jgi:hypothetical protein
MNIGNTRKCTGNARVHLFALHVRWETQTAKLVSWLAKQVAAIAANLRELGYGG